jgi:hypothetical protein
VLDLEAITGSECRALIRAASPQKSAGPFPPIAVRAQHAGWLRAKKSPA